MELVSPDASKSLWNSVSHNEGDFSCMLDETTPLKACGDLTYSVAPIGAHYFTHPRPNVFHFSSIIENLKVYT